VGAADTAEEVEEGEVMGAVEADMAVAGDEVDMVVVGEVDITHTS